ncbi:MAG TPA: glycoside hydrolase family 52 protein, partial [Candidatus Methylacidiphilales bacterium]
PPSSPAAALRLAYVPALAVELTVDNRRGKNARRAFLGFQANDPWRGLRRISGRDLCGLACGGIALVGEAGRVVAGQGFAPGTILDEANPANLAFDLGGVGLLIGVVPPGKKQTFRFAACFHRGGIVTTGLAASYFYTRFFPDIESVGRYALRNFAALNARGAAFDRRFAKARLNPHRRFMLAHAVHSYYGSTQLLDTEQGPLWAVNEGEYRMLNTFDLTVDQLFFEEALNPWTVGNELDWFARRFSYTDRVRLPGEEQTHRGGISFTHDMGALNHFADPGRSAYERAGLKGCFSQMTHEELVNWAVCALVHGKKDAKWAKKNLSLFRRVLESLVRRDHPDPKRRDGVMSVDSDRCAGGAEITTYDSLDVSLGQARNNLYLAVKCWGVYVGMEAFFARFGDAKTAAVCARQAALAAATVAESADADGFLPAILHENVPSRIIPAVEGLILPHVLGLKEALSETGPHGKLIAALRRHLVGVLAPGLCLFPDGAWKISSTSDNTWLSKVYLCQFVAETILRCVPADAMERADSRHAAWLLDPQNAYWAWSDQIVSGVAKGSKYYPRGVTSFLWLQEN